MTKGNKISKATAVKTPGSESATSNSVPTTKDQDGVMQAAITDFIRNDESVMQAIIDNVSNALVTKLLGNKRFIDTLSMKLLENGVLDGVKQSVYEANAMENGQTNDELRRFEKRVSELETANTALRDDSDAQEQYSRRNCLLVHGIPEDQTDTTDAVLSLCNGQLGLDLDRSQIDRSHRLGYRSDTPTADGASSPPKPRPVIVKLTSYETRRAIFSSKRKLKGSRYVVTENLTKRRAELLRKARTIDGITSTWTIDGRIVCLLENGRKVTVQTDSDLANVRQQCRR